MAGSLNEATLIGYLGADPEVRHTQDGRPVCNLRVATSQSWTDKSSGEKRERTEWHRVTIYNEGLCGVAEKYLSKGSRVFLRGQIQTRKWQDQSGQDRYTTEIVLQGFNAQLIMLDGRNNSERENDGYDQPEPNYGGGGAPIDDEIPFAPEWRG
ncbi:MAG: single-stranded DNA-binding protein [Alphaproteobacteria bacterium]|nr:single-stranded DNA-binding protein [Alphaproteobacteria bacterium]MBO6629041.1 single-stranded DNA-binding protein [Alphaproteobacteria bacterium]